MHRDDASSDAPKGAPSGTTWCSGWSTEWCTKSSDVPNPLDASVAVSLGAQIDAPLGASLDAPYGDITTEYGEEHAEHEVQHVGAQLDSSGAGTKGG